jgi:hypothetical protein
MNYLVISLYINNRLPGALAIGVNLNLYSVISLLAKPWQNRLTRRINMSSSAAMAELQVSYSIAGLKDSWHAIKLEFNPLI